MLAHIAAQMSCTWQRAVKRCLPRRAWLALMLCIEVHVLAPHHSVADPTAAD